MKLVMQFGVIMGVSFTGEIIRVLLPFKCPASIYGLIVMFILLKTKQYSFIRKNKNNLYNFHFLSSNKKYSSYN